MQVKCHSSSGLSEPLAYVAGAIGLGLGPRARPEIGRPDPGRARAEGVRGLQDGTDRTTGATAQDWRAEMERVRLGDRAAFAALFRHFAPRVKGFLMKSGASAAVAEDCAQDVMATVWTKAALYDPARASVSTWVFTIARNRLIDIARRDRRPEPEALEPETEPDQADVYATAEENRRLVAALQALPEPQQALIRRAYWGEMSQSEIAAETGLALGTIKSRIRLALERLRLRMGDPE